MHVGFIGAGAMGGLMAQHVADSGHQVMALDTDTEALTAATTGRVTAADSTKNLACNSDIILIMVASDNQSRAVVKNILESECRPGMTIVVTATNHPDTMKELANICERRSIGFVDAPVCYGMQGAKQGNLVSLCGGSKSDVDHVRPILMCYSRSVEHVGDIGAGQVAKTCNNMMHWAACVANFETLALAKSYGLDAQKMRETLLKCPARNTTLERWDTSRFTWHEKDMDVALGLSQEVGLSLPFFGQVDQLMKRLTPDQVRRLLYEDSTDYLGQTVRAQPSDPVIG